MSDFKEKIDFTRTLLRAIVEERTTAEDLLAMSAEQMDEYHARLVERENAEKARAERAS